MILYKIALFYVIAAVVLRLCARTSLTTPKGRALLLAAADACLFVAIVAVFVDVALILFG